MSSDKGFEPEAVAAKRRADNWREALEHVGKLYEQQGIADSSYTEAMISAVEELGPYMVLVPGVAMPHAKSAQGVKRPGQVVVTLDTPVKFGHAKNDPVDILVSFAADADGKSGAGHMEMIRSLTGVLSDAELLDSIRNAGDDNALCSLFDKSTTTTKGE
ncbi:PTS sugar transporter subunit IIA [Corynebacterium glyciniphilum]|uniref:PTS sugar transporter subunit IIA n=1 Tax=Corynebacterium glyciniphilum TaxID=1404244 RepID=UPI001642B587|nr:PTS sugar transporter subunit IIA [Corynebacterium glyciniphilum]